MIVILSYYFDGSGMPEIAFFPICDMQAVHVVNHMLALHDTGKSIKIYVIDDIASEPRQTK